MKHFLIITGLFTLTTAAQAQQAFQCRLTPSTGTARVLIKRSSMERYLIDIKLHRHYNAETAAVKEDFHGLFRVTDLRTEDHYVRGRGVFIGARTGARIAATIEGPIKPRSANGSIYLSIYSPDRRIEYGYGLWLHCLPVPNIAG